MVRPRIVFALIMAVAAVTMPFALRSPARGDGPLPSNAYVDGSLFKKAYGVLANEALMHPVDLSDWPVKIDGSRQLFVDDYLLADLQHAEREIHPPQKHPSNPLLVPNKPWEGGGTPFQIVRRDRETGKFRMWYAGYSRFNLPSGVSVRFPALYAESDDGITWHKPELGLHEYEGSTANNIVVPAGNLYGLIDEPNDPDPQRRYKGIVWHEPDYVPREGYFLYTSPDGIHWTREREQPLALSLLGYTMPQTGIGDTSIFRWDRLLGKYVGDVKFVLPGKVRCRGIMLSDDLVHWTPPRMTLYPDALDDPDSQIYGHLSFCYESMWIGFLRMMHTERTGWKQTTIELTSSRDGLNWSRVGRREEFLPLGARDEWDADYHDPCWDPILVGDELWIYYRSVNRGPGDENPKVGHAIGLATLRRDGFVSLNAGSSPGLVTTRPLSFSGTRFFLNAEVAEGGSIRVALLAPDGTPLDSYTLEDAIPIRTGAVQVPVQWRHSDNFTPSKQEHVRLRFELKSAKLYAFWVE